MNNVALGIAWTILVIVFIVIFVADAIAYHELLRRIKDLETNMKFIRSAPYYDPTKRTYSRDFEKTRRAKIRGFEDCSNDKGVVTEADIANQGERDLIGTPMWWLQFYYDENFKQENPVLYTILEAFAKDEQRRYKEENEKCS